MDRIKDERNRYHSKMKELEKENETMKEQLLKVEQMLDMVDKMEKEIEY